MSIKFAEHKEDLLFIPLGGTNEIGMNFNLYHYQGKWLIVDCGSSFASEDLPGVDLLVPDYSFIQKYKKDIVGIVLTHAHEDHIGGLSYIWQEIGSNIYTTKFTANFLKTKFSEYSIQTDGVINIIDPSKNLLLSPFSINMINLTHSAPEMHALQIKTDKHNIIHTGDWKFDPNPVIGPKSNEEELKNIGKEGVTAIVCDSTNVFNKGFSGSEGDLYESILKIVNGSKGLVVTTTFASNLARLETLFKVAKKVGRKVLLSGRSLYRMVSVAQESGYLKDAEFLHEQDFSSSKKKELFVICTGCQGEQMAAMNKITYARHKSISIDSKDMVIFSSKIIPGNEKQIFKMFNHLVTRGIEVVTERDHFVHVSGHPYTEELKQMYALLKPKYSIPVHGEPIHLHEHCKLARTFGVRKAIEVANGFVVKISDEETKKIGEVHSGYLAIDGNYLVNIDSPIFKMRRRISYSGVFFASIVIAKNFKNLACAPILSFPGCLDSSQDDQLIKILRDQISVVCKEKLSSKGSSFTDIEKFVKSKIKKFIKFELGKEPKIFVTVTQVNSYS